MPSITTPKGALTISGPAELLEQPSDAEIRDRLAAVAWRNDFERQFAESQHQLGYVETRFQLEYLCAQGGIGADIVSYGCRRGITVRANPRPKRRRRR